MAKRKIGRGYTRPAGVVGSGTRSKPRQSRSSGYGAGHAAVASKVRGAKPAGVVGGGNGQSQVGRPSRGWANKGRTGNPNA